MSQRSAKARARRRDQKADPFYTEDLERRLDKIVERSAKEVADKVKEMIRRPPRADKKIDLHA
jgi:hypothetical protein